MTFKQWLRNTFAPRVQASRASRRARNSVKLMLEILEHRLAPTVSLSYSSGTLTVAAANSTSAPATITVSGNSNVALIQTSGDTMSFSSSPPLGWSLVPIGTGSLLTAINLFPFNNNVSNLTISGPNGTTDTADTVNLSSFSSTTGDLSTGTGILSVSAGTINVGSVDVLSASLTAVNSLTFNSTGVPYLGSVTIHVGPPSGQPFAGDPYITGPDWGSYGYAPGDTITISTPQGSPLWTLRSLLARIPRSRSLP